jgi:hypothetical protein
MRPARALALSVTSAGAKILDIRLLVAQAPFLQKCEPGISPGRGLAQFFGNGTVELGQVPAGEVICNVGCGEPKDCPVPVHGKQDNGPAWRGQADQEQPRA